MASDRVEQGIALHLLAALEIGHDRAIQHLFDALHLFIQAHGHARIAQVVAQRLDDLLVGELEQPRSPFDQRHAHAKRGEHAGVFDADHAAAHHDHGLRQVHQVEHQVGVDDAASVDRHLGRRGRLGAGRDHDALGLVDAGTP